jgi:peptidoglycan/LPS O-acetylase OafA/YrhL
VHSEEQGVVGTTVLAPPKREAASPRPAPPPRAERARTEFRHIRALDGLRGVAVAAVVLYHFAPDVAPGGFLGVDLFFVLSGFLITSLLVNEWRGSRRIKFAAFWMRRARRLLPALFLVLGVVALYELLVADPVDAHHVASDGLWSAFYLANWHFIASGQSYIQQFLFTAPSPLRHMWSLAIEEQFYLVWPLVVFGVGALATRRGAAARGQDRRFRRYLVTACIVLGVISFVRMLTVYEPGADPSRVYYGTDTRAFIVLIGALVGVLSAGVPTVRVGVRRFAVMVAGVLAAVALVVAMATLSTDSEFLYRGGYGLIGAAMALVLVAAAQPKPNVLASCFSWRPLVGLGLISYGVYLWHWPIGLWIDENNTPFSGVSLFVVRCLVTLAAALASYYLVEMPIRRGALSRLGPTARAVIPAVTGVVVVVLFVVPLVAFPSVRSAPTHVALSANASDVTAGYAAAPRCDDTNNVAPLVAGRSPLVQLEGNSIAGEIRTCLGTILQRRGARLEGVNPPGFLLCNAAPAIKKQTLDPKTHPDAAVLFVFVAYDNRCGSPWHATVDELIAMWKQAGVHVYLVPSVPFVPGTPQADQMAPGPLQEADYYRQVADSDPKHVTLLDAGTFLRDTDGQYVWRMPCLPGGEPGCDPTTHTVGVRYVDGLHFCTDPAFAAHGCEGADHQAGERRAAAAVASELLASLQARLSASG